MMNKRVIVFLAGLLAVVLLAGCTAGTESDLSREAGGASVSDASKADSASDASEVDDVTGATSGEVVLTREELAEYNGKDGKPAYVAVNGVIYDVTDVPEWKNGEHADGLLKAGQDLTDQILGDSPHGLGVLEDLPVVGRLE